MLLGDFNARIGESEDFIAGVDNLPPREVIDFQKNSYCDMFTDFLISTNFCILNGRGSLKNDFTYVSSNGGASVIDYCLIPYEDLAFYENFSVHRVRPLIQDVLGFETLENIPIPDHSILSWTYCLPVGEILKRGNVNQTTEVPVNVIINNRKNIPPTFLSDPHVFQEIITKIDEIEASENSQSHIDTVYNGFCEKMKNEMYTHLQPRTITLCSSVQNKRKRTRKPWWNEQLTELWNEMCKEERKWLRAHGYDKKRQRKVFIEKRRAFDRKVQFFKGQQWKRSQFELIDSCNNDTEEFWKKIGRLGVGFERKQNIPMEIKKDNGSISNNINDIKLKWKTHFCDLLNPNENESDNSFINNDSDIQNADTGMDGEITMQEVRQGLKRMKKGKAVGFDEIPSEVLYSEHCIAFLRTLFSKCFETGKVPSSWGKGIINPIQKPSCDDSRDPSNYRGITITSSVYKLYCNILNERLSQWVENNNKLTDSQNGFRKTRSTIDQLSTLTNIIETRKLQKKQTFVCFVDFRKAYDTINRNILWQKLNKIGIKGKFFNSLKSIYENVNCSVRINGHYTDWFDVSSGLKQGCLLSPQIFNLYLNDLTLDLEEAGLGIDIDGVNVSTLLYADDLALVAETEDNLQRLLDILSNWCNKNNMQANLDKTKVVNFRNKSISKTERRFLFNNQSIEIASSYKYLGLVLDEFLNFDIMAKFVANSASRALGLVISKFKIAGGLPYKVFTKLYDTIVWPTIGYERIFVH